MITYMVLGQYPIKIYNTGSTEGHFNTLKARPGQVRRGERCLTVLLGKLKSEGGLDEGLPVVELFGGIGRFSTVLHYLVKPLYHIILEKSPHLAEHLIRHTCGWKGARVKQVDSFQTDLNRMKFGLKDAFVSLDFDKFTLKQLTRVSPGGVLFKQVLGAGPKYVCLTDTSISKVHLLFAEYTSMLKAGKIESMDGYVSQMSRLVFGETKYFIRYWTNHSGASYFLFERGLRFRSPQYLGRVNAKG